MRFCLTRTEGRSRPTEFNGLYAPYRACNKAMRERAPPSTEGPMVLRRARYPAAPKTWSAAAMQHPGDQAASSDLAGAVEYSGVVGSDRHGGYGSRGYHHEFTSAADHLGPGDRRVGRRKRGGGRRPSAGAPPPGCPIHGRYGAFDVGWQHAGGVEDGAGGGHDLCGGGRQEVEAPVRPGGDVGHRRAVAPSPAVVATR